MSDRIEATWKLTDGRAITVNAPADMEHELRCLLYIISYRKPDNVRHVVTQTQDDAQEE
jgi:hypothetical protein